MNWGWSEVCPYGDRVSPYGYRCRMDGRRRGGRLWPEKESHGQARIAAMSGDRAVSRYRSAVLSRDCSGRGTGCQWGRRSSMSLLSYRASSCRGSPGPVLAPGTLSCILVLGPWRMSDHFSSETDHRPSFPQAARLVRAACLKVPVRSHRGARPEAVSRPCQFGGFVRRSFLAYATLGRSGNALSDRGL